MRKTGLPADTNTQKVDRNDDAFLHREVFFIRSGAEAQIEIAKYFSIKATQQEIADREMIVR